MTRRTDARGISEGLAVLVSAVVGLVVAVASVWVVSGTLGSSFETLYRVNPTVEGGGVGTDFATGNADPIYGALITFIHAVDAIMGLFILVMVFIHWGAFRRLAARMRDPGEADRSAEDVAADGGHVDRADGGRLEQVDGGRLEQMDGGRLGQADDGRLDQTGAGRADAEGTGDRPAGRRSDPDTGGGTE